MSPLSKAEANQLLLELAEVREHVEYDSNGEPIHIQLFQCGVTDYDMRLFQALSQVRSLSLGENPITDEGVKHLSHLHHLVFLDLHETRISDKGMEALSSLSPLETIDVRGTNIGEAGIRWMMSHSTLRVVGFDEGSCSSELYSEFLRRHANCEFL